MCSLRWADGFLIDDIRGERTLRLDGETTDRRVNWAFGFDSVIASPSGRFVVLYVRLGTKAIVSDGRRVVRELNRSFYCSDAYEYPICLFALPDGREVVAHCPEEYNRLEIEDLETGERLTKRDYESTAADVFHSRLEASPGGGHLLSAGWVWHPLGTLDTFDVAEALRRPESLDEVRPSPQYRINGEVEAACWLSEDLIAVSTGPEEPLDDQNPDDIGPNEIGVWSISEELWRTRHPSPCRIGSLVPFGDRILSLFGHPKLLDPRTGSVREEWPDISTGQQDGSIIHHLGSLPPPIAVDAEQRRFAVAAGASVVVVVDVG